MKNNREKFKSSPLGYILSALKRGMYARPAGYKSQHEKALEEERAYSKRVQEELETIKREREESLTKLMDIWWEDLGEKGREEMLEEIYRANPAVKGRKGMMLEAAKLEYYKNCVRGR